MVFLFNSNKCVRKSKTKSMSSEEIIHLILHTESLISQIEFKGYHLGIQIAITSGDNQIFFEAPFVRNEIEKFLKEHNPSYMVGSDEVFYVWEDSDFFNLHSSEALDSYLNEICEEYSDRFKLLVE